LSKDELNDLGNANVAETVRHNINSMGKVGFWWATNLIDHDIVAREIATNYVRLFDQIEKLGTFPSLRRSGAQLIEQNPSARDLYNDLREYLAKHPPQPLNKGAAQSPIIRHET